MPTGRYMYVVKVIQQYAPGAVALMSVPEGRENREQHDSSMLDAIMENL